jgi:hypothetical protein
LQTSPVRNEFRNFSTTAFSDLKVRAGSPDQI